MGTDDNFSGGMTGGGYCRISPQGSEQDIESVAVGVRNSDGLIATDKHD